MRKITVKNKILSLFLMLFLLSNVVLNNVQAIEFDPSNNGDDETNKEYTARLLDLQINTLMTTNGQSPFVTLLIFAFSPLVLISVSVTVSVVVVAVSTVSNWLS